MQSSYVILDQYLWMSAITQTWSSAQLKNDSYCQALYVFFFLFAHFHCIVGGIFDEELGFSGYKILTFFCYIHMVSFLYHHSFSFEMVDMRKEGSLQGINHLYNGFLLARYIQQQYQEVIQVMFNQHNFMFINEATLL